MAGSSANASLPHALTVAHQRLCEALDLGIRDLEAHQRFSNAREICCAAEAFVHEFRRTPAWRAELERRSSVVEQLTASGTAYDQAKTEALRSYKGRPREPSASKLAIEGLRNSETNPIFLPHIDAERSHLEEVLNYGVLGLSGSAKDAFGRWLHECPKIQLEAKRLEADGCYYLHYVYQDMSNPSQRSRWAKAQIASETFLGGALLKPMRPAADSLMAWAEENPTKGTTADDSAGKEGGKPDDAVQSEPPLSAAAGKAPLSKDKYDGLLATKQQIDPEDRYIGRSVPILRVFERIADFNKRPDEPVLILGPTGAGKTEIAKLIHDSSDRKRKAFVPVQASDAMAQDEAFFRKEWAGYGPRAGIQDGDPEGWDGLLRQTKGGTIFVDEVADLPEQFQLFLLRVLDRKPVPPFAGDREPSIPEVRLVSATDQNLDAAVEQGKVSNAFHRRIRDNELRIPPLSERIEDVLLFAEKKCGRHKRSAGFLLCLLKYSWPGNIGELLQVLRAAVTRTSSDQEELTVDHLTLRDPSIVNEVKSMAADEQMRKLLCFVQDVLRQQGFEKGRPGAGLQQRVAELFGVSSQTAGRWLEQYTSGQ